MKRAKHFLTHKRHWLWHAFTTLVAGFGYAQQLFDPKSNPGPYILLCACSLIGSFVAWRCKPQDESDA